MPLGHPFAVELKCKRDDTEYTRKGFHRTLKKAAKQISAKLPRLIIVRIPASWALWDNSGQTTFIDPIAQALILAAFRTAAKIEATHYLFPRSPNRLIPVGIPTPLLHNRLN